MKGVYMFLADGFEEVEALAPYDVLVRGGVNVKTVCLNEDNFVTSSHKTVLLAKYTFKEFLKKLEQEGTSREDVMIFPGGMPGSTNLAACKPLMELLRRHYDEGGSVAAICAAPSVVLASALGEERLKGVKMCCYDGFEEGLEAAGAEYVKTGCVKDDDVITSRGAGHAIAFGLEILAHIKGEEAARTVAAQIML
ncbi:MAG: DJ-1 family glyoxalase III [Candidatus Cryptobacteroides sp.]|nr:DJ-1/PfpI family protein [Bacteroidales bacterium]MDD6809370.1 DJ-1/PfpI family protein [Bacteroidales bacterium]MDY2858440.1 DJ-1 family glyoxalase III [Candidatus Cryptobacteroides sp.]